MRKGSSNRRKQITDEYHQIESSLMGKPLATTIRRGVAYGVDLFLLFFLYIFFSLFFVYLQSPQIVKGLVELSKNEAKRNRDQSTEDLLFNVVSFVHQRNTTAFPEYIRKTIQDSNKVALKAWADTTVNGWTINPFSNATSRWQKTDQLVVIRGDVLYGKYSPVFGGVTIFLLYFTFLTWILRVKTPGKWLMGIRVVPLDGNKLSLWNSFGRAGGYMASVSMGGLGFFEAFWHPNRQTVHDRISGTVVVDERREKNKSDKTVDTSILRP